MRPNTLETIKILIALPDDGVNEGDVGTIITVFDDPDEAYEVEFIDESGTPIAQVVLHREDFELT